jgi:hypothetical protein
MYYNVKNMVTNILTKELYANKHEYFMDVVKCVTQQFIERGCWISTSYQVTFTKL